MSGAGGRSGEEALDPAVAFEALRAEVIRTRRAVEARPGPGGGSGGPDYTETLGAMDRELKALGQRLGRIEASQALKITPDSYARDLAAHGVQLNTEIRNQLISSHTGFQAATRQLETVVGQAWSRRRQQLWLLAAGAIGAVIGVVLWVLWAGPIVRRLPAAWLVPERMAAATLDTDRATAGQRLIESVNPQQWADAVTGVRLYRANREAVDRCRAIVQAKGKAVTCSIKVEPAR